MVINVCNKLTRKLVELWSLAQLQTQGQIPFWVHYLGRKLTGFNSRVNGWDVMVCLNKKGSDQAPPALKHCAANNKCWHYQAKTEQKSKPFFNIQRYLEAILEWKLQSDLVMIKYNISLPRCTFYHITLLHVRLTWVTEHPSSHCWFLCWVTTPPPWVTGTAATMARTSGLQEAWKTPRRAHRPSFLHWFGPFSPLQPPLTSL